MNSILEEKKDILCDLILENKITLSFEKHEKCELIEEVFKDSREHLLKMAFLSEDSLVKHLCLKLIDSQEIYWSVLKTANHFRILNVCASLISDTELLGDALLTIADEYVNEQSYRYYYNITSISNYETCFESLVFKCDDREIVKEVLHKVKDLHLSLYKPNTSKYKLIFERIYKHLESLNTTKDFILN